MRFGWPPRIRHDRPLRHVFGPPLLEGVWESRFPALALGERGGASYVEAMKIAIDGVGDGPNVVLLHGMPSAPDHFEKLAAFLSQRFRVFTPHLPGYGRSPKVAAGWTLAEREAHLVAALLDQGVTGAHLLGFSGGSLVALHLALNSSFRPHSVFALAGLCSLSREQRGDFRAFAGALRAGESLASLAGPRFLSPDFMASHPEAVTEVQRWIREVDRETLATELGLYADDFEDLTGRLDTLRCPVTARTGILDVAVPLAHAQHLVDAVRVGTLQPVEGAGHALLLEDFDATAAAVEASFRQTQEAAEPAID